MTDSAREPTPPADAPAAPSPPAAEATQRAPVRRRVWQVVLALLLAAAAVGALWAWRGPEVQVMQLTRRELVQTVVASGRVQAPHRVSVGAQMVGTVRRVPVAEGQRVSAGELLVELDDSELAAAALQSAASVQMARERLRQLQEVQRPLADLALRQARASRAVSQAALQRSWALHEQGFIGQAALEESSRQFILSDAQMRAASQQFLSLEEGGSEEAGAQAALIQTQAAAVAARARRQFAKVRAPADGLLIARNVEVGDVVQPGRALMTLSPTGRTQLLVSIDERNLHWLALGQKARASADAYPAQTFEAFVAFINPGVNAQTGSVEVKLDVPEPPPQLTQDMTVSVDIEVARWARVLALPESAVQEGAGQAKQALRLAQGRLQAVPLVLGASAGGWVEVRQGLSEGDEVVVQAQAFREGQRARAVKPGGTLNPVPMGPASKPGG
jgi:HlyD family secretion protein